MLEEDLVAAHERPQRLPLFSQTYPGLTPAAGYAAANGLHRHRVSRGWRPVGRKIGFTNRTIWPRYGVFEPIWGTVYDRTLVSQDADEAVVPLDGLVQPRIEPEVCFGLRHPPESARPADVLAAIEWIAHSVEVVQCFHDDWKLTLADSTASNGLHGRLVVGPRFPVGKFPALERALPELRVTLKKNGIAVDEGTGSNVLDSPLRALGYLVEVLAKQPHAAPLAAGELVTTGTLTDAHAVAAGETWTTQFTGLPLPGLVVRFA